jgi:hypothetical protein
MMSSKAMKYGVNGFNSPFWTPTRFIHAQKLYYSEILIILD